MLPLTKETSGILNNETLNAMPRGACHKHRPGRHVVDQDLLDALDSAKSLLSLMSLTKNPAD